jgi:tetratricopeptide (TPR) repeat protein
VASIQPPKPTSPPPEFITAEHIEKMSPAEQRQLAHTLKETAIFLSQVTEEDIKKVQAIPWEKIQAPADPKRPLTEEDKKAYRELWDMVQEGKVTMAQILGYSQDEIYKIYSTGMGLVNQGRYDDALKLSDSLLFLIPNFVAANLLRGEALRKMGRLEESLDAYNKAVAAEPTFIQSYWERSKLFFAAQNMQNFLMDMETIANLDPEAKTAFGKRSRKILDAAEQELLKQGFTPEELAAAEKQLLDSMVEMPAEEFPQIDKDGNQILKK